MREIKFRAWDSKSKQMFKDVTHAYGILPIDEMLRIEGQTPTSFYEVSHLGRDRFTVMQYTGLKDKNGREIYEGDIVEWLSYGIPNTGEIFYCNKSASFRVKIGFAYTMVDEYEVIGNICENPELLEQV